MKTHFGLHWYVLSAFLFLALAGATLGQDSRTSADKKKPSSIDARITALESQVAALTAAIQAQSQQISALKESLGSLRKGNKSRNFKPPKRICSSGPADAGSKFATVLTERSQPGGAPRAACPSLFTCLVP